MIEEYLGDGVYATYDGYGDIWLDCRGQREMSRSPAGVPGICLEPQVYAALLQFRERVLEG